MKRYTGIIVLLLCIYPVCGAAQTVEFSGNDSISTLEDFAWQADMISVDTLTSVEMQHIQDKFKPDSKKATLYAAFFPGMGQIYNKKYWKLPLVYGSFIGCAYAINWNGSQHSGYRQAYIDFIDENSESNSWLDYRHGVYLRVDPENWSAEMKRSFATTLKTVRDFHRRNRDLSYIVTVGVYALWIIDAYVDAQLFDFDISPDLSMRLGPVLLNSTASNARSVGVQLSLTF